MLMGIILCFLTGLFFLIGIFFLNNIKNKDKISLFTTSLAFIVMLGLLIFDLLPEIIENKNIYLIIPLAMGFFILVILDKLIPHHHHHHEEINDDKIDHIEHLNHIGVITIIALIIHNLLEGLTLYSVTLNSLNSGILMMIGVSLHNIPLGFQIGNSLKERKLNTYLIILLCLSSCM